MCHRSHEGVSQVTLHAHAWWGQEDRSGGFQQDLQIQPAACRPPCSSASPGSPPGANRLSFRCTFSVSAEVFSVQMLSLADPIRPGWPGVWLSPVSPDIFSG